MNPSTASSVALLQNPHNTQRTTHSMIKPFFEPLQEHQRWNGQAVFIAEDEELTPACESSVRQDNRRVHLDGGNDPHAFLNSMDPCLRPASVALSIQSGAGVGRARAGKRKSRVSSKVPIKVFSADAANFMAIVHRLTGFHSTMCLSPEPPRKPLLEPLPFRPSPPDVRQGMCNPGISGFSSTLSHLNSCLDQSTQLGSFGNCSPSAGVQGAQAILSRHWQPMREYHIKEESCTDIYGGENKLP